MGWVFFEGFAGRRESGLKGKREAALGGEFGGLGSACGPAGALQARAPSLRRVPHPLRMGAG